MALRNKLTFRRYLIHGKNFKKFQKMLQVAFQKNVSSQKLLHINMRIPQLEKKVLEYEHALKSGTAVLILIVITLVSGLEVKAQNRTPEFNPPTPNPFGLTETIYSHPTFADLDGDGDLDIFVGTYYDEIQYFENRGNSTNPAFITPTGNPFGLTEVDSASKPAFADLDGDGDLDLFTGESFGDTKYFENIGSKNSPSFASPIENPFGLVNLGYSTAPTFADLDGDGDLDLFMGEVDGNTIYIENIGDGNSPAFTSPVTNPYGLTPLSYFSKPSFADLDSDGDLDLIIGGYEGGVKYFENTGNKNSPAFAEVIDNPFGLEDVGIVITPAFADLDGDGDQDAFLGELLNGIYYFNNTSELVANAFANSSENPFGLTKVGFSSSPIFADLDSDGDLDAFIGNHSGEIKYFENIGNNTNPTFSELLNYPFGLSDIGEFSNPTFSDLDGDGDLDLFVGNKAGNIEYFQNTGSNTDPNFAISVDDPFGLVDIEEHASPTFCDMDGDGDLDLVVGDRDGNINYFQNMGSNTDPDFITPSENPFGLANVGGMASPTFTDFDGDGDLDAFIGAQDGNTHYFENTGNKHSPLFEFVTENPFGLTDVGANSRISFVDLDGDGDLDAFIGEECGNIKYFSQTSLSSTDLVANFEDLGVSIFSNDKNIHLDFSASSSDQAQITIYDISGKLLFTQTGEIDLLPCIYFVPKTGIYITRVETRFGTLSKKLFIK